MTAEEIMAWFDEIAATRFPERYMGSMDPGPTAQWAANAQSALESIFPAGHPVMKRWTEAMSKGQQSKQNFYGMTGQMDALRGIFDAGHAQIKAGRVRGLVASIQARTNEELLEQADQLLADKYLVAATVIAGGALETHLRHLCERNQLASWKGEGTINKYNDAIAQERNNGHEIFSSTDTNMIKGWGSARNEAAHAPGEFKRTDAEVRMMIDGIRQFMARVA